MYHVCHILEYRVKSGKFGHTFANSVNPDETAPYEPSHQDFHCLLSLFNFHSSHSKIKETRSLSEFTRLYSSFNITLENDDRRQ